MTLMLKTTFAEFVTAGDIMFHKHIFVIQEFTAPCGNFTNFPKAANEMSWAYISLTYTQNMSFFGNDSFKAFVNDSRNAVSYTVHLQFAVMESLCRNEGTCERESSFYVPGSNDQGHIVFVLSVCLFVCLSLCLSVVNFTLRYNF